MATACFFAVSLGLAYMVTEMARGDSLVDRVEQSAAAETSEDAQPASDAIPGDDTAGDETTEETQEIPE
ncbi:hypothetical protein GYB61_13255 [bacterium]|nr:hypothetical protein [bacterium]